MDKRNFNKMVNFLKKLPEDAYSLRSVVSQYENKKAIVCCPIGWMPEYMDGARWVFPKESDTGMDAHVIYDGWAMFDFVAHSAFDIPVSHAYHLFTPNMQKNLNLPVLSRNSTCAEMIEVLSEYVSIHTH